ncbi:MAG: polyprenyl synthetase family protein, partial [Longimicrobiales bacterium]|nr:polyprenyl synthetase family protein [Longimicrobiales bacterium]
RRLGVDDRGSAAIARHLMAAAGAGGMGGGQWLDLLGEGKQLDAGELGELHGRKTGALLAASLVVGAMAAGASGTQRDAFQEYGTAIGLAFQIADDILDATASAEELGKNPSDAELDKSTYVALHGLEGARQEARQLVDRALAGLSGADIRSEPLEALARYVVERER